MTKADIYTRVTNQIIEAMERGHASFQMPWHSRGAVVHAPINAKTKRIYRGVNTICLWATADARGYESGLWATYQQWKELGAQVRKAEKATEIVFWKSGELNKSREDDEQPDNYFVARGFSVFNVAQVDGFDPDDIPVLSEAKRVQSAEAFFARLSLDLRFGGERAFYDSEKDYIQMPEYSRFRSSGAYYSTLAHETVHWTGAPYRLNRDLKNRFGLQQYAAEELIAELGAAFTAARLGTFAEPRGNHAAYVANWLELLRDDKRAIFTAASKAQQAVDWLIEQAGLIPVAA